MPTQTASQTSDTLLFAPAELDWFRHTSAGDSRPMFKVVFEAPESQSLATEQPWWRGLLEELS